MRSKTRQSMEPQKNAVEQLRRLSEAAERQKAKSKGSSRARIQLLYPAEGPLRREFYPKHVSFFEAGAKHRERCFMAANRIGKTEGVGAYEVTCHLTGDYPAWWKGKRFHRPVKVWAAGDTSKTVREIIQTKLLGNPGQLGAGMIPKDRLLKTTAKSGVADAIDTAWVRHASGGTSLLVLKSYDQRRESFQGTEQDVIWLDEEPPMLSIIRKRRFLSVIRQDVGGLLEFEPEVVEVALG